MPLPTNAPDWALFINRILDEAYGTERYPTSVVEVATAFSARRFPTDPIDLVQGGDLEDFQGALLPDPKGEKGWAIIYNHNVPSKRRIRFTLAHEFGHYLMHRTLQPEGFQCDSHEVPVGKQAADNMEKEADIFASHFLIPPYDLLQQIPASERTDLNMLSVCADRYGVSMLAMIRQWLNFTEQRAVLVVSRDGFILWSQASKAARKSGHIFKSKDGDPIEIPASSLACQPEMTNYPKDGVPLPAGSWFADHPVLEMAVRSERYDFVASLLMLDFEQAEVVP